MIYRRKKTFILVFLTIFLISSSFTIFNVKKTEGIEPYFTLNFKVLNQDPYPDFANLIKQHLSRIGINIEIVVQDLGDFLNTILVYYDYDIISIGFGMDELSNYLIEVYNEDGTLNLFGYHTEMDYDESLGTGKNEWYMQEIYSYIQPNSNERYELCWEWQNYLMDKILPMLPLFTQNNKIYYYNNLEGYNYQDGLLQSWGKLNWDGLHDGQISQDEVVYADFVCGIFSPFWDADCLRIVDNFIIDCIMDSLFWRDSDLTYWPHIVKDWSYLAENHLRLTLREGIKWQSDPRNDFPNEYLDAVDIYFTLYCYKEISIKSSDWYWLEDFYIVDKYTIDLIISEDYYLEDSLYNQYLDDLSEMNIVPEHFLNQTQLTDSITPDITHQSWLEFDENPFGTGLFNFVHYKPYKETVLTINSESWWLNSSMTNDELLNWQLRFGDFSNSPNHIRIRNDFYGYNSILNEFYEGKLDLYEESNYLPNSDWLEVNDINIQIKPTGFFDFIGFNLRETAVFIGDNTPCYDFPEISKGLAIRKAIAYAINREEINDVIYGGEAIICDYPISPILGKWCDPNIGKYCLNLDWGNAFMRAAGFMLSNYFNIPYPDGFPDWEYACSPINESSAISVNFYYYIGIFGVVILLILKRRKNRIEKN